MEENLRIAQINGQRSKLVMWEIRKIIEELKLDIICIQEPYVVNSHIPFMPLRSRQILYGNKAMAATVIINEKLQVVNIAQFMDTHVNCLEIIHRHGSVILVNYYFQFSWEIEPFLNKLQNIHSKFRNKEIIHMCDCNAKSTWWFS